MEWFEQFIIQNFVLVCIGAVLLIYTIQRYKEHPKISFYTILIVSMAMILSVVDFLQDYFKTVGAYEGTFICSLFGYSLRPLCIYLFILMSVKVKNWKFFWITAVPLLINFVIYLMGVFPEIQEYFVHFHVGTDGIVYWDGGQGVLRFTSHVVSLGYLAWLIVISLSMLKFRHVSHSVAILLCALFVVLAVVIETFVNGSGNIRVVNTTMVACAMFYYLYLYVENTQIDTLTGLFNRETYYNDILKMDRSITGVIQFDMNGLKYLNDNFGHFEGDKALAAIAEMILKSSTNNMYAYRLGGDEFIVIANDADEESIKQSIEKFRELIKDTSYHCSIGYSYRTYKNTPIDDLLKEAEKMMYEDKAEFYRNSRIERRKI